MTTPRIDGLVSPSVIVSKRGTIRITPPVAFLIALCTFSLSALVSFWLKAAYGSLSGIGFSGFFVPDAISLEKSLVIAWHSGWEAVPNIYTFLGVVLVYYPITIFGDVYALVGNVLLLTLSACFFYSTVLRIDGLESPVRTWMMALMVVATNFYIVSSLSFPNKEVPLILLTSIAVNRAAAGSWHFVALSILLCYWFRDGYAFILAMATIVVFFRRISFVSGGIILTLFLILLFVTFPLQYFSSAGGSLQRNVAIGALIVGDKFSALGDVAAYGLRLIGNASNLGLRPQIVDIRGGLYLLGFGYWQFGVTLLAGLIWSARNMFSNDVVRGSLALIVVVTLLGISYGTFVQPRYMMPLIFVLTLGLSESRLGRYLALPAAIAFPIVFLVLGGLPPLADG